MFKWLILLNVVLVGTAANTPLESRITGSPDEYSNYRLPKNTIPQHYNVWLRTWVDEGKTNFQGRVTIRLIPLEANTRYITIHHRKMEIGQITLLKVTKNPIETIPIDPFTYNKNNEHLTIPIKSQDGLLLGQVYELTIDFLGNLRTMYGDSHGFYRAFYKIGNRTIWYAATQFEPTDARHAFPCYDEPAIKATFDISITHTSAYNAISNMPVKEIIPIANSNHVTTIFNTTVRMSTYTLAFVVSDYIYREDSRPRIKQRIYAHQNFINETEFGLEAGVKILEALEKYLDFPYSLPKMDHIAIAQFAAGAMENWGLVTYKEEFLYFNPKISEQKKRVVISSIIGHELGHQWFGNLITPEWWTYIWLNEGFATLYQWEAPQMAYPEDRFGELFTVEVLQTVFERDGPDFRPMTSSVNDRWGINMVFDHIAYLKSGSVLRMAKHFLTEKIWKDGLKRYFAAKQYDVAVPDDLFASFDAAAFASKLSHLPKGVTVKTIMDSWHLQSGYPIVKVNRIYGGGNVFTAHQEVFIISKFKAKINTTWWIPISLSSRDRPDQYNTAPNLWLPQGTVEANFSRPIEFSYTDEDWILINKQQTGYYRVNYDERNWKMLANELVNGDLSKIQLSSRAQLLDDVLDIARYGQLDHYSTLSILNYLRRETEYLPWAAADRSILWLRRLLINSDTTGRFRYFMRDISNAIYAKYGVTSVPCEFYLDKQARNMGIKWACLSGNTACHSAATAEIRKILASGQDFDPDLRSVMYCAGMRGANREDFNALLAKFENTPVAQKYERFFYLISLMCNENTVVLRDFLEELFSNTSKSTITIHEKKALFEALPIQVPSSVPVLLEFVHTNPYRVADILFHFGGWLARLAQSLTTPAENEILEKIITKVKEKVNLPTIFQIRYIIKGNLKWVANNAGMVNKFLTEIYGDTVPTSDPSPEPPQPSTTAAPAGSGQALTTSIVLLAVISSVHFLN